MTPDPSLTHALDTLLKRRAALDKAIAALQDVIGSERGAATLPAAKGTRLSFDPPALEAAQGRQLSDRRGARTDTAEAIIRDRGPFGVSPQELADALSERGVPLRSSNPARAARAIADRVRDRNPEVKLRDGRFVHQPESKNGTEPTPTRHIEQEEVSE